MIRFARLGALTAGMLLSALLSSCATSPSAHKPSAQKMPKTMEERVSKRWDLLIAHKAEEAYEYLSPGFRQTKPKDEYAREMNGRPVTWNFTPARVSEARIFAMRPSRSSFTKSSSFIALKVTLIAAARPSRETIVFG